MAGIGFTCSVSIGHGWRTIPHGVSEILIKWAMIPLSSQLRGVTSIPTRLLPEHLRACHGDASELAQANYFVVPLMRSRTTMRAMNQALRAYRLKRRLGSSTSRKAHSRLFFCIQRGARRTRFAAKSIAAPTLTATGTPSAARFAASQRSPFGIVKATIKRSGWAKRMRDQCCLLLCGELTKWRALSANDLKVRVTYVEASGCFLGNSFSPSQKKQAVSLPGRLCA